MIPGDKFYYKHDTKRELFTLKAISEDGEWIESKEIGGWSHVDGAIFTESAIPAPESFVGEAWLNA